MNYSKPGLPVHHQLSEFTQSHVRRVGNAIQPSHPLSSPSPPAPNPSQHQSHFQWVNSSHEVAKVLEFQLQHQSFQDWSPLGWTGWISLQFKGLSRVFSNTTVQNQGRWPGRATPRPRSGVAAERNNPTSKDQWLQGCRRAERSYSTFKVRRGGGEEIPLVQGKEQQLRFAGAAVKRYPTSKVRETQVRW